MFELSTINGNCRMSTQELLLEINRALAAGETEFTILASGQHDIGGPLWHPERKSLKFIVTNPGQRLGSMCLEGTEIIVRGSAPADVGWLNTGGRIVVQGDAGDTTSHCAASGSVFIGGRVGTRSGSMMKHDPQCPAPEFWVLKNCGSFSFEFMSGGIAVVCGYECEELASVLGDRACVGMVGGILYFRGRAEGISAHDVKVLPLGPADVRYLAGQMDDFLGGIDRPELAARLSRWSEWHKAVPLAYDERPKSTEADILTFRTTEWVDGGIFSDVANDDKQVIGLVTTGLYRQRVPRWENALYNAPCETDCPASIPSQKRFNLLREGKIDEAYRLILEYTPFPGSICGAVCPNPCMDACSRNAVDIAAQIGQLGSYSQAVSLPAPEKKSGKKVAVIGGGPAGLSAAWQLVREGHAVTVFEAFERMGGKMEQVIPKARLPEQTLAKELKRISDMGVVFQNGANIDEKKYEEIRENFDATIVATGAHITKVIPWPGHERIVKGLDFLKAINRGEKPAVGKRVIVIGCGNSGMDVASGAYRLGAQQVTCIDVQAPAAFAKEIAHVEALGGQLLWPVFTKEITPAGLITQDGKFIPGDMVIIAIGENPDLGFLPKYITVNKGYLNPCDNLAIANGVFAAGDNIRPGRLVDAVAAGRQAALAVNAYFGDTAFTAQQKTKIPATRLHTAYFRKCHVCNLPSADSDHLRCISCGTCRDCEMCLKSCPENAISKITLSDGGCEYVSDSKKCIGCGICSGVCPCGVWSMYENAEPIAMYRNYTEQKN